MQGSKEAQQRNGTKDIFSSLEEAKLFHLPPQEL